MKNKGFIQIPILVVIILSTLFIGGVSYVGVQMISPPKSDTGIIEKQETEDIETLKKELDDLKAKQAEQQNKDNEEPKIIERIIERPVVVEQLQNTPTPSQNITSIKETEKQAFNTFWQNSEKAWGELSQAIKYNTDALNSFSISYAQNAIDSCNSGYQINLNNNIPSLPFSADLTAMNKIIATLGVKCKQMAQATQDSFKKFAEAQSESYSLTVRMEFTAQAQALNLESSNYYKEYSDIWSNQLIPAATKAQESAQEYFK